MTTLPQLRDVDNANEPNTTTCVRAGVETRTGADCRPVLPDALEQEIAERDTPPAIAQVAA
jgi:hypothetical protein